jgi:hypothetical protein
MTRSRGHKEVDMAVVFQKNVGLLLLAVWLILYGLTGFVAFVLPAPVMSVLALLAGILILVGR